MKRLDSTQEIVGQRGSANLSEGYAAVFATIVIWSTPSLFQYYLNRYYDPWAQNFYRFYSHILFGALRNLGEPSFRATWLDSQFRPDQSYYLSPVPPAHLCIWQNWHSASRGMAC